IEPNHELLKKLERLGFILEKKMTEHPGKAFCRFICFKGENPRKIFYLEFVSIGRGGIPFIEPGISFGYETDLAKFYKKVSKKFHSEYNHKNYDWKKNSEDLLPGWNSITFKKPIIKNVNIWFTEYEDTKKPRKLNAPKHINA